MRARHQAWYAVVLVLIVGLAARAAADPPVEDTLAALDAALATSPDDTSLVRMRAELLLREGQPALALDDLHVVLAITPRDVVALVLEARALAALGRLDQALAVADHAVEVSPTTFAAWQTRAALRVTLADRRGAIDDLDAALALAPEQDAYLERARLLRAEGRVAEAALGLEVAMQSTHDAAPIVLAAIDAWLAAGNTAHALDLVEAAIERAPTDPRLGILRGDVLTRAGRIQAAQAAWQAALDRIDARLSRRVTVAALVDRGEVLARLGLQSDAEVALARALSMQPGYARATALSQRLHAAGGAR